MKGSRRRKNVWYGARLKVLSVRSPGFRNEDTDLGVPGRGDSCKSKGTKEEFNSEKTQSQDKALGTLQG